MLSETLKALRSSKDLSQKDLSVLLGVSQQTIGSWEVGRTSPDPEMINKIAQFFVVSTDYLLGNDSVPGYYRDAEVAAIANEMKDNPDMRILFDASKDLSKEDLKFVVEMVNRMKKE